MIITYGKYINSNGKRMYCKGYDEININKSKSLDTIFRKTAEATKENPDDIRIERIDGEAVEYLLKIGIIKP